MDHRMSTVCGKTNNKNNKTSGRLKLMPQFNGLLRKKPSVGEELHCDHMQSDTEPSDSNSRPGQDLVPPFEKS